MTLNGHQKKYHFPKTDSCNENAHLFFTFRTQIVFAYFSKKWHLYKKRPVFFTNTQKTLFSGLFLNFLFPSFSCFLFFFLQHKKTKTKSAHFFRKPFFWHPDKLPKNYFRTPTHYLFLIYPKNTIKLRKNKQKKILDQVLTQPWTKFWLKKPQILDQVLTLYVCISLCLSKPGALRG